MMRQVKHDETSGKTVRRVATSLGVIALVFEDDTFIVLGVENERDESPRVCDLEYDPSDWALTQLLVEVGAVTQEEVYAQQAEKHREQAYDREMRARQEYALLWQKFGGKPLSECPEPERPESRELPSPTIKYPGPGEMKLPDWVTLKEGDE